MSTRTDVHRPGAIIPADYRELFCYAYPTTVDGWPVPGFNIHLLNAQRIGARCSGVNGGRGGVDWAEPICGDDGKPYPMSAIHKGGACDSCGAYFVEGSLFLHSPSGECIVLGHICANKMGIAFDASAAATMKGQRKAARKSVILRKQRRAGLRAWAGDASPELRVALRADHYIVKDIRARLIQWGKVSEKQAALVVKIAADIAERASQPAEVHVPAPIADGRQTVTGTVVSVKLHEGAYGDSLKMTVKVTTSEGTWLAWGTAPSALLDEVANLGGLRGCVVRFDCKLKAGRDAHFALLSRPTKGEVLAVGDDGREVLTKLEADYAFEVSEGETDTDYARKLLAKIEGLRELIK